MKTGSFEDVPAKAASLVAEIKRLENSLGELEKALVELDAVAKKKKN